DERRPDGVVAERDDERGEAADRLADRDREPRIRAREPGEDREEQERDEQRQERQTRERDDPPGETAVPRGRRLAHPPVRGSRQAATSDPPPASSSCVPALA